MKTSIHPLAKTLLLTLAIAAAAPATALDPATSGGLAGPANRIVGAWANNAFVGPCGGAPSPNALKQTLVFHAGGTFLDNSRFPPQGIVTPNGVMQRSIGVGTWKYSPLTGQWSLAQRFDWYKNNVYDGYQVITRSSILLSGGDETAAGPVYVARYNAAGVLVMEQCGYAESTRL